LQLWSGFWRNRCQSFPVRILLRCCHEQLQATTGRCSERFYPDAGSCISFCNELFLQRRTDLVLVLDFRRWCVCCVIKHRSVPVVFCKATFLSPYDWNPTRVSLALASTNAGCSGRLASLWDTAALRDVLGLTCCAEIAMVIPSTIALVGLRFNSEMDPSCPCPCQQARWTCVHLCEVRQHVRAPRGASEIIFIEFWRAVSCETTWTEDTCYLRAHLRVVQNDGASFCDRNGWAVPIVTTNFFVLCERRRAFTARHRFFTRPRGMLLDRTRQMNVADGWRIFFFLRLNRPNYLWMHMNTAKRRAVVSKHPGCLHLIILVFLRPSGGDACPSQGFD